MTVSTESSFEDMDDLADLLDEEPAPPPKKNKGAAVPIRRTAKQVKHSAKAAEAARVKAETDAQALREKAAAQRLAQIVNLHIAGLSLAEIGLQIGATADEVDRMLQQDAQRYVRNQPALRVYVRNMVSKGYADMLAVDMPVALDPTHAEKLDHQDRVIKMLDRMAKLHGAEAPVQTEVEVKQAPEAIDRIVAALASQGGLGAYDDSVFDLDEDDVEEVIEDAQTALTVSGNAIDEEADSEENPTWT
jgi:hypothetical protein